MAGRRNKVMFLKPEEPAFLKKMKAKIGYQEGPTVDTKREQLPKVSEEDLQDREDEKPVVVVLESEKVSETEAKVFLESLEEDNKPEKEEEEDEDKAFDPSKKILFRKRDRSGTDGNLTFNKRNKKEHRLLEKRGSPDSNKLKSKNSKQKQLLSFSEEDE